MSDHRLPASNHRATGWSAVQGGFRLYFSNRHASTVGYLQWLGYSVLHVETTRLECRKGSFPAKLSRERILVNTTQWGICAIPEASPSFRRRCTMWDTAAKDWLVSALQPLEC